MSTLATKGTAPMSAVDVASSQKAARISSASTQVHSPVSSTAATAREQFWPTSTSRPYAGYSSRYLHSHNPSPSHETWHCGSESVDNGTGAPHAGALRTMHRLGCSSKRDEGAV